MLSVIELFFTLLDFIIGGGNGFEKNKDLGEQKFHHKLDTSNLF